MASAQAGSQDSGINGANGKNQKRRQVLFIFVSLGNLKSYFKGPRIKSHLCSPSNFMLICLGTQREMAQVLVFPFPT